MPECAPALDNRKHCYNLYHRERYRRPLGAFRTTQNHYKRFLKNINSNEAQSVQAKFDWVPVTSGKSRKYSQ